MNRFEQLQALGAAKTRDLIGKKVIVGTVANVPAIVSPTRREQQLDKDGNLRWVDAGDVTIAREDWPEDTPVPVTGQQVTLPNDQTYRVGAVTPTEAIISFSFSNLY